MIRFSLLGPVHVILLLWVPLLASFLIRSGRRSHRAALQIPYALALLLAGVTLTGYGLDIAAGWSGLARGLPLQLCDLTVWMTVVVLFNRNERLYDVVFYWGLVGTGAAILMPDLTGLVPVSRLALFFASHGLVVVSLLYLNATGALKASRGSALIAWGFLQAYIIVIGGLNVALDANYFYLCQKPIGASVLDWMGPWPYYIAAGDVLALALFGLVGAAARN